MAIKATDAVRPAAQKGKYQPKLTDPRVRDRIKLALGWSKGCLGDKPRELAKTWIEKNIGQQQNELSAWLRRMLLVCKDHSYSWGAERRCKTYSLNRSGWEAVRSMLYGSEALGHDLPEAPYLSQGLRRPLHVYDEHLVSFWARRAHAAELDAGQFSYAQHGSARLWHPLQNIDKDTKRLFWRERLPYNYDIVACAPTLILRRAQALGMDEWLPELQAYLNNAHDLRSHLCSVAQLDPQSQPDMKKAKALVNALFCGARLGASPEFALFRLLDSDVPRIRRLQKDERLARLRNDIRTCWKAIEPSLPVRHNEAGRKLPLGSRQKWEVYFRLERAVLDVVRAHLDRNGVKYFLEHDGWRTDRPIDTSALVAEINASLGFRVSVVSESLLDDLSEDFGMNPSDGSRSDDYRDRSDEEDYSLRSQSPSVLKVTTAGDLMQADCDDEPDVTSSYSFFQATGAPLRVSTQTRQSWSRTAR